MKTLWHRLTSPTPAFWRKVRTCGLAATAVGAAMTGATPTLPAWIPLVGSYLTVAGGVTVALASMTCSDTPADQTPS